MKISTDDAKIEKLLTRGVEEIIEADHLREALRSGRKLRVKLGIDPTAPDLHLGHTVVLRKLRQFQNLGHQAVLIIGDFTAQIGDPSGRSETRKPLDESDVKKNMENYLEYAGKVINLDAAETRRNSEWLGVGLKQILELSRAATVQQILRREDFKKRLEENSDISVLETLYPLLQGYDSVAVKADLELGGTDQKFNLLMGRRVQRHFKQPEQDVLTVPLIEGTDGARKMSKSYGNYIGLAEKPDTMFAKVMTVPDALLVKYFDTLTDLDAPEHTNPRDAKLALAAELVRMYHSADADAAKEKWVKTFSGKSAPTDAPELSVDETKDATWLVVRAIGGSKAAAWRLIQAGGVKLNGEILTKNPKELLASLNMRDGDILQIGKHRFWKLKIA